MVEQLFKLEIITILVITHGLKWEFDSKVFMVALLDTAYYDPKAKRWIDYSIP